MRSLVAYCRISTRGQSHAPQLDAIRARMGAAVAAEVLEVASGVQPRPLLEQLVEQVEGGRVGGVVVAALDRLGRDLPDLLANVRRITAKGGRLVSVRENIDTEVGGHMTQVLITLLGLVADLEGAWIRERTRAGLAAAAARGVRIGRPKANVDVELVRRLRGESWSWQRIASACNVSESTVKRAARAAGGGGDA